LHADRAGGDGDAVGFLLVADIDHMGLAGGVEVGQCAGAGGGVWCAIHGMAHSAELRVERLLGAGIIAS